MRPVVSRRALLAAGALAAVALAPAAAPSHAVLVRSSPPRRAALGQPPRRVELVFNERLEAAYSSLSVWSADGVRVDGRDVLVNAADPRILSVGLPELSPGTYTVRFRVLSVDGHVVESTFPFSVAPRGTGR
jgi:methionine-rich copper-binding protein CopC